MNLLFFFLSFSCFSPPDLYRRVCSCAEDDEEYAAELAVLENTENRALYEKGEPEGEEEEWREERKENEREMVRERSEGKRKER